MKIAVGAKTNLGQDAEMADDNRLPGLSREEFLAALEQLNTFLVEANVIGELCLFGGTVMVLVFNARLSTRDVEAIFQPAALIRELAERVAEERGLATHWLNDGVKGFQAAHPEVTQDSVPQFSNLRIFRPSAQYLLAMKCLAARTSDAETAGDQRDMIVLMKYLDLRTVDEVTDNLLRFFPPQRILPKTEFMIHEAVAELSRA